MVGKVMRVELVGAMAAGTLSVGSAGEGYESYEIKLCSSLIVTSSFSFLVSLGPGEIDLEGVCGSRVVFVVGVSGEPGSNASSFMGSEIVEFQCLVMEDRKSSVSESSLIFFPGKKRSSSII